ncbi:MAG TPA: hypothetical protein VH481_02625 [Nitrososphaeraceae archaeon]|jgi:hypothetical protein
MTDIFHGFSDLTVSVCLARILSMGGKISKASSRVSNMLNGLDYYSIEVTMNENYYHIQAYGKEANELYTIAMSILDDQSTIMVKAEKDFKNGDQ